MRGLDKRIAGLLALALGAVAVLALSGVAAAKDRGGDDNGHHGHHGRHHHHHQFPLKEAGTISSFDATTGKLTIALTGGDSVTGLVTEGTRIKCEGVDDRLARRDHGGGEPGDDNGGHGNEPGDDNGGQVEPGDDHGGRGNEPGDDNGGESSGPGPSGEAEPANGEAPECTVASLVPGTVVGDAELRLEGGMAIFEEVELGSHS